MADNEFLPFATAGGANVLAPADWAALASRLTGWTAGVAKSEELNTAWRQSASIAAAIGQFIADYGNLDALDDGNTANLVRDFARSLQQGSFLLGVATGTANAWVLTPVPSVAAYAVGRPMMVVIPATNTSTTVNANVSGLGNRRVKKSDGTDPAIGDLVSGRLVWCADDGTNIRILATLPSDIGAALTSEGGRILNYRVYTTTARTVVTGPLNPGLVLWSQTYPKQKAGTRLVLEAMPSLRLTSSASTTYARARLNGNAGTDQLQNHFLFINNNGENYQPPQFTKFSWSGVDAGDVNVEFRVGQQLSSTGTVVINPSTVDTAGWVNGYSSVFTVYEVEN